MTSPREGRREAAPPGRFTIRPDPLRYLRESLVSAPLVLIAAGAVAPRLFDELGGYAVTALAVLFGVPGALFAAYAHRHGHTVALEHTAEGWLALTDWRGRRHTLRQPDTVCYCTIYSGGGRMRHIVVSGPLTEVPLVLRTAQWRTADLSDLWRRLGLTAQTDDLTSVPGVCSRFPRVSLPYPTRHPMTCGLLGILVGFAYIALVVSAFRALAGP